MPLKTAKTIKEYRCQFGRGGAGCAQYDIMVPVGSLVNNSTACGFDDDYRFLQSTDTKKLVGYEAGMLAHDLAYYGLNIPEEYCEAYPK